MPTITTETLIGAQRSTRAPVRPRVHRRAPRPAPAPTAPATYDATAADTPQLARTLAWAFEHDPAFGYLLGDHGVPRARIERFFAEVALPQVLSGGGVHGARRHAGAALWIAPHRDAPGLIETLLTLPKLASICGRVTPRALRAIASLEGKHPSEPHHHLWFLGVDPLYQGRGIGAALMAPILERADREGMPAYVEATTARSRDLYLRHGFEVTEQTRWAGGGPPLWLMWRRPRGH